MNSIDKLTQIFSHFPGIGPRQAKRFVYYLLTRSNSTLDDLVRNISQLKKDVAICRDCRRFYEKKNTETDICYICSGPNRDHTLLMIVPRDSDLETVEKSGTFNGLYFVLGGSVPILEKEPNKKIRADELITFLDRKLQNGLREIILATNFTPEGENTADYVQTLIEPKTTPKEIKLTHLGKGLSMGTELEYADSETIKNALKNRA
jgi:recombination protein RecR